MEAPTDFLRDQAGSLAGVPAAADLAAARELPERLVRLSGFGQSDFADAYLFRPVDVEAVREVFALAQSLGRKVVLVGSGRSYGDAAVASEALAIDMTRMRRILSWDRHTGVIDCEAGLTIEGLWRHCLDDGWWPPVVSGTMHPTLGGALGMNIHGKNAYRVGPIGEHVLEIDILTPQGELLTLTPEDSKFRAVIGGFGMFGAITRVKLQMKRITSGDLEVLATSPKNWDEQFTTFERHEANADYMVSWIDAFGRGNEAGRGQFHAAWYRQPPRPDVRSLWSSDQDLPDTILGLIPKSVVWRFLKPFNNRTGMRLVNWAKDRAGRLLGDGKTVGQSLVAFSFLLDYVPNWRNAYQPGGFIQYQTFVPKAHAKRVFARQVEMQQEVGLESFLAVLKRHRTDDFLFTHGVDGYSLALDFKVTRDNREKLWSLCHRMNDLVLEAGGRFYLAKDSTLRPEDARAYLGEERLASFRALKAELDPQGTLTSGLAERLFRSTTKPRD